LNNNNWNANLHGVVLGDERTNKLIILSDKRTTTNLEKIIKELDKKSNLYDNAMLYKIKNADATLISNLIQSVSNKKVN
jgi:type II secretory pathway component GspD/PulD (secretin)